MTENMTTTRIYHNPRCSKSRQTLQLLEDNEIPVDVIQYLKTPPTLDELRQLVQALDAPVAAIVRTSEAAFKEIGKSVDDLSDDDLYQAIVGNPVLLQRPIVVHGQRAAIGRPPEGVLALFQKA